MTRKWIVLVVVLAVSSGVACLSRTLATVNEVTAANRYTANGTGNSFAYSFKVYSKHDLEVLVDSTVKTVDVHYIVSGVGASGGGNVVFLSPPAANTIVTILRKQPKAQSGSYTSSAFSPSTLEKDLDRLSMQIQELTERVNRSLLWPKSSILSGLTMDTPIEGRFARYKVGGGIEWVTPTNAGALTSPVAIGDGGTGATTAASARANLGVPGITSHTLIDAKGDLLGGTADDTLARVPASATTGYVLTADPLAATGMSWAPHTHANPLINGNMEVWQRGTTFAAASNNAYSADRWKLATNNVGVVTINRSTNVPTAAQAGVVFNYSLEVDVTTVDASVGAGDYLGVQHIVEGSNWRSFAQRQFTLSFWAMSSKTGTHAVSLMNAGTDRAYVAEYTITAADTWEQKSVTFSASPATGTWDYTNGAGLRIFWMLMTGSNYHRTVGSWQTISASNASGSANQVNVMDNTANFFRLTGVKLELGSVATPIEFVPFEQELQRAKRYYQKSFEYATVPANGVSVNSGEHQDTATKAGAVTNRLGRILYPIELRTVPGTLTIYTPESTGSPGEVRDQSLAANMTNTLTFNSSSRGFSLQFTGAAGTAVGDTIALHWTADAEL